MARSAPGRGVQSAPRRQANHGPDPGRDTTSNATATCPGLPHSRWVIRHLEQIGEGDNNHQLPARGLFAGAGPWQAWNLADPVATGCRRRPPRRIGATNRRWVGGGGLGWRQCIAVAVAAAYALAASACDRSASAAGSSPGTVAATVHGLARVCLLHGGRARGESLVIIWVYQRGLDVIAERGRQAGDGAGDPAEPGDWGDGQQHAGDLLFGCARR